MQSLRAVKRLQGALPQWLRGITASSVEESGSLGVFTLVEAPSVSYMLRNRTRTFTSAAMASREYYDLNGQAVEDDIVPEEFETIEAAATMDTVHKLPTDINEIGRLNPELLEAMQAHEQHIRSTQESDPNQLLDQAIIDANGGKPTKLTKTALARLRVDQLRSLLESFGADPRGNKAILVTRLLESVKSSHAVSATATAVADLDIEEGFVTRTQLDRAARLRAREAISPEDVGISNQQLLQAQAEANTNAAAYAHVFSSPHDVARLLVEARADDIAIIDVRGHCTFTDYMVLATGRSPQLIHMLAQGVLGELKRRCQEVAPGVAPAIEGAEDSNPQWLVVDAGSVVVHIFGENARREYDLEGLWGTGSNVTRVATPKRHRVETLQTMRV